MFGPKSQKDLGPNEDGRVYISGTNSFHKAEVPGIYQAEINIETGNLLSERRLIWEGTGAQLN